VIFCAAFFLSQRCELNFNGYTAEPSTWYVRSRWFFKFLGWLLFRIRVIGKENIPRGNYIVIGNHLSWIDPFLLVTILPARPRLYFIGARQTVNRKWKERVMQKFDVMIPVERGAQWVGKDIFKKPSAVLRVDAVLGLFPEGALGTREGDLLPLQRGIGHILLNTPCSILPIALSGVQELYFGKALTVTIGKPFQICVDGLDHRRAIDAAVAQVEKK